MQNTDREATLERIWDNDTNQETIEELIETLEELDLTDTTIYNFLGEIYENERVLEAFRDYYKNHEV